ncbi:hypothetical protein L1987_85178 [Smallanthus sonchifolius]|uniref:Uncharacterized protein n=1 Tax=Smallanthus sonchifolius TaxID=185202 RepID=A0ACB8XWH0_9ASTR|nr:hypothetical protein L1987_85178 [Smallanthus sonchifolius]
MNSSDDEKTVLVHHDQSSQPLTTPPLLSSYNNDMITRPLFDANSVCSDITIVDLPGIPIHGQSQSESEKISDILETYVKLEDCVILNVISATADFLTCESNKISKKYDKNGERTVHVFTKADKASEDMVAIVTTNYTGPDYVCVINQIGDETHEEARAKEATLFKTHHLIDKSMVGVRVVAQKLFLIQSNGIYNRLCGIVRVINEDLNTSVVEQNRLQHHNFTTVSEAMPAFLQIINMSKESLCKIVVLKEFDEFPEETQMHCCIRLREMSKEFSQELKNIQVKEDEEFLAEEIIVLEERKWSREQVFHFLFQTKIANISAITNTFVSRVWDYIEVVIIKLLGLHAQTSYPQLFSTLKKAAKSVIARQKESFKGRLLELLDKKKMEGYTRDPRVICSWNELKKREDYPWTIFNEAFDIKTRMVACLEMVRKVFFDSRELDLPSMVYTMVVIEMETQMVNELKSDGENRYKPMLKESTSMTTRRWKLKNRIELLEKLKKVVETMMDEISFHNI